MQQKKQDVKKHGKVKDISKWLHKNGHKEKLIFQVRKWYHLFLILKFVHVFASKSRRQLVHITLDVTKLKLLSLINTSCKISH